MENNFEIRLAREEELEKIMAVFARARIFMRENGNPTQWPDTYPDPEAIRKEIRSGDFYVCLKDGEIALVFLLLESPDPNYAVIDGKWPEGSEDYYVVHRFASAGICKGAGQFVLEWVLSKGKWVRIDTHNNNRPMKNLLSKLGFEYCGVITLLDHESDALRDAYCKKN